MDKILVEVFLPAANHRYDVYVPAKSKVYEVIQLLGNSLEELSKGFFTKTDDLVLCDQRTMKILDINLSMEDQNYKNGAKLILI